MCPSAAGVPASPQPGQLGAQLGFIDYDSTLVPEPRFSLSAFALGLLALYAGSKKLLKPYLG